MIKLWHGSQKKKNATASEDTQYSASSPYKEVKFCPDRDSKIWLQTGSVTKSDSKSLDPTGLGVGNFRFRPALLQIVLNRMKIRAYDIDLIDAERFDSFSSVIINCKK